MRTVLVVEDEPALAEVIEAILGESGFTVVHAVNGLDALRVLGRRATVDLVLLDLSLPGMSGFEVLEQIRAIPRHAGLPVVLMSASRPPPLPAEATGFLAKPFGI